jgi:hypothetical protein
MARHTEVNVLLTLAYGSRFAVIVVGPRYNKSMDLADKLWRDGSIVRDRG